MKAIENSFKGIMIHENKLIVPFFQRKYVWKEDDWEELFNDLKESYVNNKDHFLGSVIFRRNIGTENFVNVIDGQQRITTFSILVKALCNEIMDEEKIYFKDLLIATYTQNEPKIKHSRLDFDSYKKIIQDLSIEESKENSNLEKCYFYFKKRVKELQDCFEFLKFIVDSKLFVMVNLEANEDEQKIFDSINSTGVPLNATDIIKNVLFDTIIKILGENKAIELYKKYWEEIFQKNIEETKFWDSVLSIGRLNRARSEIFLHAFALIENIFDAEKHSLTDLSKLFKEYISNNLKDENTIILFLEKLVDQAKIYRSFPQINQETAFSFDDFEERFFQIFGYFDINVFIPLVMFLKKKNDNYKNCLKLLEILILCNSETKDYNKFVSNSIQELKKSNDCYADLLELIKTKNYKDLKKENIKEWLLCITNKDANCILFWLELFRRNKQKDIIDTTSLNFVYTLEHLAPQKWQENWSDIFDNEEEANYFIYQIGNMTLLKGKLNSSVSNNDWQTKLNGSSNRSNSIKKSATLSINKEIIDIKQWNKECIEKRTDKFLNEFFEIWNVEIFAQ